MAPKTKKSLSDCPRVFSSGQWHSSTQPAGEETRRIHGNDMPLQSQVGVFLGMAAQHQGTGVALNAHPTRGAHMFVDADFSLRASVSPDEYHWLASPQPGAARACFQAAECPLDDDGDGSSATGDCESPPCKKASTGPERLD